MMKVHGEGSFFQRKDRPGWFAEFSVDGHRYTVHGATKQECQQALRIKRADIERGLSPATTWTFERYAKWWLETKEHSYRANTFHSIRTFLEVYAIPEFGKLKLARIAPTHVQNWLNERVKEGKLKPSTIRKYFNHLYTCIQYAVKTRMIPFNPCQHAGLPAEQEKEEQAILTPAQAVQLVDTVPPEWQDLFLFAIGTGARRCEILACRWADIDRSTGLWKVTHNVAQIGGFVEGKPKTRSSVRTIALPEFVLAMLDKREHSLKKMRLKAGETWENRDLIFCTETGGFISVHLPNNVFKQTLKSMGAYRVGLSFHSIRHWVATWLYDDGQLPQEIQALLGHSKLATTTGVYGHRRPGRNVQVTKRLNDIVSEGQQENEKSG